MTAAPTHSQPIVELLRRGDARKCPWDTDAGNKIEPDTPCPVCGDFGNDAALNEPTKCVSTNQSLVMGMAADRIEKLEALLDWLDRQGGLGYEKHDRIRAALQNTGGEK